MTPETEVIACPACKHLVRVPLDWLGTQVQCPECKAMFRAPVRDNGKLTEPELLSRPATSAPPARKADLMLLLPAFGLMFVGFLSLIVNAGFLYQFVATPGGAHAWAKDTMVPGLRKMGFVPEGPPEKQAEIDEQEAAKLAVRYQWFVGIGLVLSPIVVLGGFALVFRRGYRFAQVACVLAALNFPHLCCVPGAVFSLWGLLMLNSDEAREHFGK